MATTTQARGARTPYRTQPVTASVRDQIIAMLRHGYTHTEISNKLGVSNGTIQRWKYRSGLTPQITAVVTDGPLFRASPAQLSAITNRLAIAKSDEARRRLQAMLDLAAGLSQLEVARKLKRHPKSIYEWRKMYAAVNGDLDLFAPETMRKRMPPKGSAALRRLCLTPEQRGAIEDRLTTQLPEADKARLQLLLGLDDGHSITAVSRMVKRRIATAKNWLAQWEGANGDLDQYCDRPRYTRTPVHEIDSAVAALAATRPGQPWSDTEIQSALSNHSECRLDDLRARIRVMNRAGYLFDSATGMYNPIPEEGQAAAPVESNGHTAQPLSLLSGLVPVLEPGAYSFEATLKRPVNGKPVTYRLAVQIAVTAE